jgi:molybdopterin-binding protein
VLALRNRHARELSSGESQRVSLARAFVLEPELLLLDEPFASVDASARSQLIDDTERLLAETSSGCVLVTHDLEEAGRLGSRMAVIVGGRLLQDEEVSRVLSTPADAQVAAFVGVQTRLPGRIVSVSNGLAAVEVAGAEIEAVTDLQIGQRVLCCLRPEDITVRPIHPSDPIMPKGSARNRMVGRITRIVPRGPLAEVTVDCGPVLVAHVTRASEVQLGLGEGIVVEVSFKATAVHLIALQD